LSPQRKTPIEKYFKSHLTANSTFMLNKSRGAQLVFAKQDMKNIINTRNKGMLNYIGFYVITISLKLQEYSKVK